MDDETPKPLVTVTPMRPSDTAYAASMQKFVNSRMERWLAHQVLYGEHECPNFEECPYGN